MIDYASFDAPPYNEIIALRRIYNISQVPRLLGKPSMQKKIASWAERNAFSTDEVREKIKIDPMFAAFFAIEPSRQSIHQSVAAQWITAKMPGIVENFKVLPSDPRRAWYVENGALRQGNMARGGDTRTKSIDFYWTTPTERGPISFYAAHKFTKESGGAQDNQFKDLENFVDQARNNQDRNVVFLAIADGDLYQGLRRLTGESRLQWLQNKTNGRTAWALTSADLPSYLAARGTVL